jgi:hypothetical protein
MAFSIKYTEGVRPGKKLQKFNRNNVGIEDNFQVSSFTAFGLNNRMSTNMSDTTVKNQSICLFPRHEITRDDPSSSWFEI